MEEVENRRVGEGESVGDCKRKATMPEFYVILSVYVLSNVN